MKKIKCWRKGTIRRKEAGNGYINLNELNYNISVKNKKNRNSTSCTHKREKYLNSVDCSADLDT